MTTLVNQNGPSNKKKGRSKKANVLSAAVQKATENFIIQGEQIAHDFPEVENDMLAAIDEVRKTGKILHQRLVLNIHEQIRLQRNFRALKWHLGVLF